MLSLRFLMIAPVESLLNIEIMAAEWISVLFQLDSFFSSLKEAQSRVQ